MDSLRRLLEALEMCLWRNEPTVELVASNIGSILEFLIKPGNNTDENCKLVDEFIATRVLTNPHLERRLGQLPSELAAIIEDMGMCLHDAHSARPIARNFASTPAQLLSRLKAMSR